MLLSLLTGENNHPHLCNTTNKWKKKEAKLSPTEHKTHSMSPVQDLACNEEGNYMTDKMLNPSQLEHLHRLFFKIHKRFLWLLENWNFNWKNWAFLQVYLILFSLAELHGCLLAWLFPCWLALPLGWVVFFPLACSLPSHFMLRFLMLSTNCNVQGTTANLPNVFHQTRWKKIKNLRGKSRYIYLSGNKCESIGRQ